MLNSIQACRAVIAILIVMTHANVSIFGKPKYFPERPFGDFFDFMIAGVDFFFVLSGFLIYYAHTVDVGQPRALLSYLWKRYSRVYLLYWIVLAAVIPVFFFAPQFGSGHERDFWVIVRSILLVPEPSNQTILIVAWTLPYEMLFYFLFAFLVINRKLGILLFGLWTIGSFFHQWFGSFPLNFVFSVFGLYIVAGMLACLTFQKCRIPLPRLVAFCGGAFFFGAGIAHVYFGLGYWAFNLSNIASSVMMILGFAEADRSQLLRPPGWLVYLGDATYSMYLVHFPALSVIAKLCKAGRVDEYIPDVPLYFLHVVGAVMIGCVCHHVIEKPLLNWSKRYFRGNRAPSTVVETHPLEKRENRKAA